MRKVLPQPGYRVHTVHTTTPEMHSDPHSAAKPPPIPIPTTTPITSTNTNTPPLTLKVPSLYDSLLLETRIHLPSTSTRVTGPGVTGKGEGEGDGELSFGQRELESVQYTCGNDAGVVKVAVVAHPYAPLGGNFDDHVVVNVMKVLVQNGWVVGTFNFRSVLPSISCFYLGIYFPIFLKRKNW